MDKNNLKIEFRACPVIVGTSNLTHRLEYRISPEQDLSHYVNVSWLGGLIKFRLK